MNAHWVNDPLITWDPRNNSQDPFWSTLWFEGILLSKLICQTWVCSLAKIHCLMSQKTWKIFQHCEFCQKTIKLRASFTTWWNSSVGTRRSILRKLQSQRQCVRICVGVNFHTLVFFWTCWSFCWSQVFGTKKFDEISKKYYEWRSPYFAVLFCDVLVS